jgi:DNA-binding response OmpR family regulator
MPKPNVLIVEDDFAIADMMQEVLEADGYCVSAIARTVKDAIMSAELHNPDFAVIDIRLANGDLGSEVGAHLRVTSKAGIMFSTGNSNNPMLTKLHGDAVMTKPYNMGDVGRGLAIVRQMIERGKTDLPFPPHFRLLGAAVL